MLCLGRGKGKREVGILRQGVRFLGSRVREAGGHWIDYWGRIRVVRVFRGSREESTTEARSTQSRRLIPLQSPCSRCLCGKESAGFRHWGFGHSDLFRIQSLGFRIFPPTPSILSLIPYRSPTLPPGQRLWPSAVCHGIFFPAQTGRPGWDIKNQSSNSKIEAAACGRDGSYGGLEMVVKSVGW